MKYTVIGWTYYSDSNYPTVEPTFAINHAVIEEIKAKKYLFTGYHHQEYDGCVPVINTGEKVIYSRRGFGGVMAEAYGYTKTYDYAIFTDCVNPDKGFKLPKEYVDDSLITTRKDITEIYNVDVSIEEFARCSINEQLFLPDLEEYRFIEAGDKIIVNHESDSFDYIISKVNREKDVTLVDQFYFKFRNHYPNKDEIMKNYEEAKIRIVLSLDWCFNFNNN